MADKKYVSSDGLNTYTNQIKQIVSTLLGMINNKADANHNHDNVYYTKAELQPISHETIDSICGTDTTINELVDNVETQLSSL